MTNWLHSTSFPITTENLPKGPRWEADGSCWEAVLCDRNTMGCDWRWQPLNTKALGKDKPEGEMTDYYPPPNIDNGE